MQIWTDIRFTSLRSPSGYDCVPFAALETGTMAPEFIKEFRPSMSDQWLSLLRPKGPEDLPSAPLDKDARLFRHFADLPYEPNAYTEFCDRWGLLNPVRFLALADEQSTPPRTQASSRSTGTSDLKIVGFQISTATGTVSGNPESSILSIAAFHSIVRSALKLSIDAEPPFVAAFRRSSAATNEFLKPTPSGLVRGFCFLPEPARHLAALITHGVRAGTELDARTGSQAFVLRPANLMVAIALQTVKYLSGEEQRYGVRLVECQQCSKQFEVGPGTGRRITARFCSRECQERHRYQMKKARMEKE